MAKTVKQKRIVVPDENIIHIWECPKCDEAAEVNSGFYCENGEPFCCECDCDMEYIRTEIIAKSVTL